jgi:hypothetical protein
LIAPEDVSSQNLIMSTRSMTGLKKDNTLAILILFVRFQRNILSVFLDHSQDTLQASHR